MTSLRLDAVQIENFRSIGGPVSIPLGAPIVLLHGANGTGKSTVMSAIELALTGRLSDISDADLGHLIHHGRRQAGIALVSSSGTNSITLRDGRVEGRPLLGSDDARFFVERCYLQQRLLTSLLDIYQGDGDAESQLTSFVNELLGLDELVAFLEGTHEITDKRLFRHLVPEYAALETDREAASAHLARLAQKPDGAAPAVDPTSRLREILAELRFPNGPRSDSDLEAFLREQSRADVLVDLTTRRREVLAMQRQLGELGAAPAAKELEDLEKAVPKARRAVEDWRATFGQALEDVLALLRPRFPSLPDAGTAEDPANVRASAVTEVRAALARLEATRTRDAEARAGLEDIKTALAAAAERLKSIDSQLGAEDAASDAEDLAKALAALLPHTHTDDCPVCGRNFGEISREPLVAHLATRISGLSERAQRLGSLARARLEAVNDIARLEDKRTALRERTLPEADRARTELEVTSLAHAEARLVDLEQGVAAGAGLIRTLAQSEREYVRASERARGFAELVTAAQAIATASGRDDLRHSGVAEILRMLTDHLNGHIAAAERVERLRSDAERYLRESREEEAKAQEVHQEIGVVQEQLRRIDERLHAIDARREELWDLRRDAERARVDITRRVFNDALNAVWRDLFVRLAPEEAFVPVFRTPDASRRRVVAELATLYRDTNEEAGAPGAMLSTGNLNTAALTLFLALHFSVRARLPWLLLDDPVQSMDEVHVQQFAALLRTLAKQLGRRLVIAVHERSLFEYLALELSAAQPGDALITVELSRARDGATTVHPSWLEYVADRALEPTQESRA